SLPHPRLLALALAIATVSGCAMQGPPHSPAAAAATTSASIAGATAGVTGTQGTSLAMLNNGTTYDPVQWANVQAIFSNSCLACHGANGIIVQNITDLNALVTAGQI